MRDAAARHDKAPRDAAAAARRPRSGGSFVYRLSTPSCTSQAKRRTTGLSCGRRRSARTPSPRRGGGGAATEARAAEAATTCAGAQWRARRSWLQRARSRRGARRCSSARTGTMGGGPAARNEAAGPADRRAASQGRGGRTPPRPRPGLRPSSGSAWPRRSAGNGRWRRRGRRAAAAAVAKAEPAPERVRRRRGRGRAGAARGGRRGSAPEGSGTWCARAWRARCARRAQPRCTTWCARGRTGWGSGAASGCVSASRAVPRHRGRRHGAGGSARAAVGGRAGLGARERAGAAGAAGGAAAQLQSGFRRACEEGDTVHVTSFRWGPASGFIDTARGRGTGRAGASGGEGEGGNRDGHDAAKTAKQRQRELERQRGAETGRPMGRALVPLAACPCADDRRQGLAEPRAESCAASTEIYICVYRSLSALIIGCTRRTRAD